MTNNVKVSAIRCEDETFEMPYTVTISEKSTEVGTVVSVLARNVILLADECRPKRGRWIVDKYPLSHCSECGNTINGSDRMWNYCPNCGAKMEVDE